MLRFFPKDVAYGSRPDVGLCTLWTPRSRYESLQSWYGVCGQLYSTYGIGILMRNVLADENLSHLVITGKEIGNAGNADRLLGYGVYPADVAMTESQIDAFYRRVIMHDMRDVSVRDINVLQERLQSLPQSTTQHSPVDDIPLPTGQVQSFPSFRSGYTVRSSSIRDAHNKILAAIRRFGLKTKPDKEGHWRQELWQLTVCLDRAEPEAIHTKDCEMYAYGNALWYGDEPEDVTYRYGHTMRHRYGDQISEAIRILAKKHESFRPVISLWEPLKSMQRDDEPCLITVHPRLRDGILDMFAYIRTNEMFRGWPVNASGLRILQKRMADKLYAITGDLTITSGSAHIYDYDVFRVDEWLSASSKPNDLVLDPMGSWRVYGDGNEYIAEHYHNGMLIQTLRATTPNHLMDMMTPFVSDVRHAMYLGEQVRIITEKETDNASNKD